LKVYFVQQVDCTTGINRVALTGIDGYIQRIVADLPSAQGEQINCTTPEIATRKELKTCTWPGLPAKVVPSVAPFSNKTHTRDWFDYSIFKGNETGQVTIRVAGQNTRACRIAFDSPISDVTVVGGVSDPRFHSVGETGSRELRLWHREWSQPWNVSITWDTKENSKLSGRIICLWSDANGGEIPAFDELQHYLPVWAIPSKISDGLVEGFKHFQV
jgi:hypothetical protein